MEEMLDNVRDFFYDYKVPIIIVVAILVLLLIGYMVWMMLYNPMKIDWEGFQEISPQDQKRILQWFHELQEDDAMCQQELRQMICGIDLMENKIKDLQEQLSDCQKGLEDARGLLDQKESDLKRLEGENKTLQAELDQFLELLME